MLYPPFTNTLGATAEKDTLLTVSLCAGFGGRRPVFVFPFLFGAAAVSGGAAVAAAFTLAPQF